MTTNSGRAPYLVKVPNSDSWYIRDGSVRRSTRTSDRSEATAALARYIEARFVTGKVRDELRTLGSVLDFWGEQHRRNNPSSWDSKWKYLVGTLKRHAGWLLLADIDKNWSREYAEARYKEGVQDPSVRQELSTVKTAWKHAKSEGRTKLDVPGLQLPPPSEPRDTYLTKDEARRLLDACEMRHLKLFVRLGIATGGRPGAILALNWSRVHLDRELIDLRTPSTRADRNTRADGRNRRKRAAMVPVEYEVVQMLRDAQNEAVTDRVIEYAGRPISRIQRAFRSAVERAGLDPEIITPHILRHSAATWMAQDGVSLWEIAGFLGHKDISMVTRVYGHHSPTFLRGGMRAVSLSAFVEGVGSA